MEQQIQEIRELEKLATPGPWVNNAEYGSFLVVDDIGMRIICDPIRKIDAALIVSMRNNILAILDDNERLRADNSMLREKLRILQPIELHGDATLSFVQAIELSEMQQKNATLQRERDAAVADLKQSATNQCSICKHEPQSQACNKRITHAVFQNDLPCFEWRGGPQEVEHG